MPVQNSYGVYHDQAYAGMVADGQLGNAISKLNGDTVTIPYGKGVVSDGENSSKLPVSGSVVAEFNGVAIRELNRAYADGDTFGAPKDMDMSVLTQGVIWVTALVTVVKDEPVFLRVGATDPGDFSNIASSGATLGVAIDGAKFLTGGGAGDLVKISLGMGG